MYIPSLFAENDRDRLHAFIERYGFGVLVSQDDGVPLATHLPFLLDRDSGPNGALLGHMARANPQWQQASGQTVLAVFSGPHAYVSPTWYEADGVVPTWNYTAVHAYGPLEIVDGKSDLLGIITASVRFYEQGFASPWSVDETAAWVDRLLDQVVGFRIPVARFEGKWKLNQNQPAERRRKVIRALREQGGEEARAVADLVEETLSDGASVTG